MTIGKNGVLTKAREAKLAQIDAEIEEELKMAHASFKAAQANREIEETNVYIAQTDYIKNKMQERYGYELEKVYKSGRCTKTEFKNNDKVYVLRYDGTVYNYVRMKPTNVYAKLENEGTLYLRATKKQGYEKINIIDHIIYTCRISNVCELSDIKKVVIEEEIAPKVQSDNKIFMNCENMISIENAEKLHTENMTTMNSMFFGCKALNSIELTNLDTDSVNNMSAMFSGCSSLKSIDLSSFGTEKVTNMENMFSNCPNLEFININNFDTTNRNTNITSMFLHCSSLKELDLGDLFEIPSNGLYYRWTFSGVPNNVKVKIGNRNKDNFMGYYDFKNIEVVY